MATRRISTRQEYRDALERVEQLRASGADAEDNAELAELEGSIAAYVIEPGKPEEDAARPRDLHRGDNQGGGPKA